MISDDLAKQLHDKVTRGEPLSVEEQMQLEKWYALQDNAESMALNLTTAEKTLTNLQTQIDAALVQLMTVTKRIQEIAAENETLRRETITLRYQLAHLLGPQPA
ncbi:MAG: hypothetical protein HY673_03445 [Chloroflexi bacterium]|nr:hypothetical protein [Chloroflexota bacterium]